MYVSTRKRLLSLLLVLCMVISLLPMQVLATETSGDQSTKISQQSQQKASFNDVKQTDWCYDAVEYVKANSIFSGTGETIFAPTGTMTRAMFVTVLGRMAGVDPSDYRDGSLGFVDVPDDAYYAPYLRWATKHGLIFGTGSGRFSPNDTINREQMAVLFVRYFEAFDIEFDALDNISTLPSDTNSVASYAQDAVKKLWNMGFMNGDGKSFNPKGNATRAQAASICMRTDRAVETWYKEPGVPSERVRIEPFSNGTDSVTNPDEILDPQNQQNPTETGKNKSNKQYYEVRFEKGKDQADIMLPDTSTYVKGTPITNLPTPNDSGMIFLGWYYDYDLTEPAESDDKIQQNTTLYAKAVAGEGINALETPNYMTVVDQPTSYTFGILDNGESSMSYSTIINKIKITQVTLDDPIVEFELTQESGVWKCAPELKEGQTYKVELLDDNLVFVINEEEQGEYVRFLNILTAKDEVKKASLNKSLKSIAKEDTNISEDAFYGLFQIDESGETTQNSNSGEFTYDGNVELNVGDALAVLSEDAVLGDMDADTGRIAYVKILEKAGDVYSYEMAEIDDVLFMPEVFPIASSDDQDSEDGKVTISSTRLSEIMAFIESNSLDIGDFIGFYNDADSDGEPDESEALISYGRITSLSELEENHIISYTDATREDIESVLDVYYSQNRSMELTEAEELQITKAVRNSISQSDFPRQAALYAASFLFESDNLEELPNMEDVNACFEDFRDAPVLMSKNKMLMSRGANTAELHFDPSKMTIKINAHAWSSHLKGDGFCVDIKIPCTVTINNSITIELTAQFTEEVILNTNIKTETIGPWYDLDYRLTAGFEVGSYTAVKFQADFKTGEQESESMTKKLDAFIDYMERFSNANGVTSSNGEIESLAEIYTQVMESANETWLDIVNQPIINATGDAFYHVFCYQIKASFVVSANICASMGLSFSYTVKKQYDFTVDARSRKTTNKTTDIIAPNYSFDFYVIGTLGLRAGLRLEMYVGLFSLDIDKIGISAEAGAYARLWGYFFYNYSSTRKKHNYSGATLIEIGMYLDIKFIAQLVNSDKLKFAPTIYAHEWPLWSAGDRKNIYGFNTPKGENFTMTNVKEVRLPGETFVMKYMDLKNGDIDIVDKDDATESNYLISFTNPIFSYNPATNSVIVDNSLVDELVEEGDMFIIWKPAALAFSNLPVQKKFHFSYTCPEDYRYINFDSQGGSSITTLVAKEGDPIIWPDTTPTKIGYTFDGWYNEPECTNEYVPINTMPIISNEDRGITLYAKWTPNENTTYTVVHYRQSLGNPKYYEWYETEKLEGTTGATTEAQAMDYFGFEPKSFSQATIKPDGSTEIRIEYDRIEYHIGFVMTEDGETYYTKVLHDFIGYRHKYGEIIDVPANIRPGYTLVGWKLGTSGTVELEPGITIASENAEYIAIWEPNVNKVIFDRDSVRFVTTGEKITNAPNIVRPGYEFGGWYKDASCITPWNFERDRVLGPTEIYAKWNGDYQGVAFETYGGSYIANQNVIRGRKISEPTAPTKENCTFVGWYKEPTFENEWDFDNDKVAEPMYLYAKWVANEGYCLIVFDTCGKGDAPYPIAIKKNGSTIPNFVNPPRPVAGYRIEGWYRNYNPSAIEVMDQYQNRWTFGDETDPGWQINYIYESDPDTIILYAKWIED